MARHRDDDRRMGVTGEADPEKVKAEYDAIVRKEQAEADRVRKEQAKKSK